MRFVCYSAVLWAACCTSQAQTPPTFTVTDLGVLPGKAFSQAIAISSNGTVVGYSATTDFDFDNFFLSQKGAAQGWIYANGLQTTILPAVPAIPLAVNSSGQVVGIKPATTTNDFTFVPFFSLNGGDNTPGGLNVSNTDCGPCGLDYGEPVAISDTGVVALTSDPEQGNGGPFLAISDSGPFMQAAVWSGSSAIALPLPADCPALQPGKGVKIIENPSFCLTRAIAISGNGQYVAGYVWYVNRGVFEPAIWNNGQLKTFGQGGLLTGVNNSGQAVGRHAGSPLLFDANGAETNLGSGWFPAAINNNNWVVGNDSGYAPSTQLTVIQPTLQPISRGTANAILWINNTKYNLNTCSCISNSAGWELDYAYAVNDAGQIVGTGFHNGVQTGFLLTPLVAPTVTAVVNGASFVGGGVVPGEIATAFGTNLTSSAGIHLTSSLPLPSTFLTDSLTVNSQPVPLFAVDNVNGQQQINFQVPWEAASGPNALIAVSNNGTISAAISVPVLAAQPGIFNYTVGANTFGAILHANFQLADTGHPAKAGETVLIYCTGLGAVSSPPADGAAGNGQNTTVTPVVTIGGTNAIVSFSGLAPGFVGLYQINAELPSGLTSGNQPIVIEMSGTSSNSVLLPIQ